MMRVMNNRKRDGFVKKRLNQSGMTLFEILLVLVILGIFSAALAPSVSKVMSDNEKRQHLATAMQLGELAKTMVEIGNVELRDTAAGNGDKEGMITQQELTTKGWIVSNELLNPSNDDQPYGLVDSIQLFVKRVNGVYYYDLILKGTEPDGMPQIYIDTTTDDNNGNAKHLDNLELSDIHLK